MIRSPWRKMLRDLWLHLPRTLLVVLTLTLGIFSVGSFLDAYSILMPTIDTNFAMTNPASAVLRLENVDSSVVNKARHFPGVTAAEARRTVSARIRVGPNQWVPLILFVLSDFNHLEVAKIWPVSGSWPPGDRQLLIERASIPLLHAAQGDNIVVRPRDSSPHELTIAGIAFDPGQAPAWVEGMAYGYITQSTLQWLGGPPSTFNDLLLVVSGDNTTPQLREVANRLAAALRQDGVTVQRITAGRPEHPHLGLMNGFLYLLEAFALLCLGLSGVLTATLISALLSQQIRQIGVMKAVGARTSQIIALYLGAVLLLSCIALVIALPLGALAGKSYARLAADMLNFDVLSNAIPLRVIFIQVALGILVPLLTAAYPVFRGSRMSVREAISDYGVALNSFGTSRLDTLLTRMGGNSRPLALSLRNAFRRRGRMALTLLMLTVGGGSFMAALGSAASLKQTIDNIFATDHYDMDIRFERPYPADAIAKSIRSLPGVTQVETWGVVSTSLQQTKTNAENVTPIQLLAPPTTGTTLIAPPLIAGRWLLPEDINAIVINTALAEPEGNSRLHASAESGDRPHLHVGDEVTLGIHGVGKSVWRVVGIVRETIKGPAAYSNYNSLEEVTHQRGVAARALVTVKDHDPLLRKTVSQALEQRLTEDHLNMAALLTLSTLRQGLDNHVIIMQVLLMLVSLMLVAVGALGLASTMSLNVMERTREIGMMRAIGASTQAIMRLVLVEGAVVGALSWLMGCLVSLPLMAFITTMAGELFLRRPLDLVFPLRIPLLWLAVVLFVGVVASFYPAWRAARLTVREALAYE